MEQTERPAGHFDVGPMTPAEALELLAKVVKREENTDIATANGRIAWCAKAVLRMVDQ